MSMQEDMAKQAKLIASMEAAAKLEAAKLTSAEARVEELVSEGAAKDVLIEGAAKHEATIAEQATKIETLEAAAVVSSKALEESTALGVQAKTDIGVLRAALLNPAESAAALKSTGPAGSADPLAPAGATAPGAAGGDADQSNGLKTKTDAKAKTPTYAAYCALKEEGSTRAAAKFWSKNSAAIADELEAAGGVED